MMMVFRLFWKSYLRRNGKAHWFWGDAHLRAHGPMKRNFRINHKVFLKEKTTLQKEQLNLGLFQQFLKHFCVKAKNSPRNLAPTILAKWLRAFSHRSENLFDFTHEVECFISSRENWLFLLESMELTSQLMFGRLFWVWSSWCAYEIYFLRPLWKSFL